MNAICLVFDRLHAGYLGAYGNSWIETPELDRLASESFLLDQALIDTPRLEDLYRSYWQGLHALAPPAPNDRPTLMGHLRDRSVATTLLTDERLVGGHALAVDFDDAIQIDPPWQAQMADEIDQTHFARCFAQLIDWLHSAQGPFLLWCHLAGLGTTWDAPPKFRRAYWEPGDPKPSVSAEVPDRFLPEDFDPDEVFDASLAYAGQVSLLDTCIGALLEFLQASPLGKNTLLVLGSARGFPLGEHRRLGPCDEALYGELVRTPCLLRFPDGRGAATRTQALAEPSDLWATLLDWWGVSEIPPSPTAASLMPLVRQPPAIQRACEEMGTGSEQACLNSAKGSLGEVPVPIFSQALRDRLCLAEGPRRAIRTPAWYLRVTESPELFAKPDDRWEVNNVAGRCQEVVEMLLAALTQYERTMPTGRIADLPPLDEVLRKGLE